MSDSDAPVQDVTGYCTEAAERILKSSGVENITVVATSAPSYYQKNNKTGSPASTRVLRQKLLEDGKTVELTTGNF